jgi:hypothetical protein
MWPRGGRFAWILRRKLAGIAVVVVGFAAGIGDVCLGLAYRLHEWLLLLSFLRVLGKASVVEQSFFGNRTNGMKGAMENASMLPILSEQSKALAGKVNLIYAR